MDLLASDEYWDPHAVAGLLKSFLRELPASILTRELHLRFLAVIGMSNLSSTVLCRITPGLRFCGPSRTHPGAFTFDCVVTDSKLQSFAGFDCAFDPGSAKFASQQDEHAKCRYSLQSHAGNTRWSIQFDAGGIQSRVQCGGDCRRRESEEQQAVLRWGCRSAAGAVRTNTERYDFYSQ